MEEHLCWHLANFLAVELCIPYEPWTATEVECYLTETVVHRQGVAVALYATLVAKGLKQTFAKDDACILYGVVFVYVQVAVATHVEVHHAVAAYLLEHVVEEAQPCLYVALACAVEVYAYGDVCLVGGACYLCGTLASEEDLSNLLPCDVVLAEYESLASKVLLTSSMRHPN